MGNGPLHPCPCSPACPVLLPRGVTRCRAGAVKYEHQRQNYDVRRWYRTARWKHLRTQVLREQPICITCQEEGQVTPTTDVDHIEKHYGNERLFFQRAKLQGLCKSHHSAKTARGK